MLELSGLGVAGPLAAHVEGFRAELTGLGYSPRTARDHGYVLAQLSRWVAAERISPDQLTEPVLARFADARRGKGYRRWRSRRSLRLMVDYLRRANAIPPDRQEPGDPLEALLGAYRRYLVTERGLAPSTVAARMGVARRFLEPRVTATGVDLQALAAADVTGFLLARARQRAAAVKPMTSPLRCLLRFLFVAGLVGHDLAGAVPAAASPRLAPLPGGVDAATVTALLASCDRGRPVGQRDFAILTLLVRLGLRAGEVAALQLDDIDWRAGEITVTGKGSRTERLPLPVPAGEALAAWLTGGRPRCESRAVFVTVRRPYRQVTASAVRAVMGRACDRAGLERRGAHRLRHALATEMLRAGASLPEIGQVLRHRSLLSTSVYAKVDQDALRPLARPWPGGGQ